jgi:uncharacterized protein YbjT (DUF2867 family)
MTSLVLVTGGTGRLGQLVVRRLEEAGCDVHVLTRRSNEAADGSQFITGDLRTGEGVAAAVDGVAAIVHCATSSKGDVDATRNLVQAASRAGASHLVYVSIVGIDQISSWGYPKAKLQSERLVAGCGLPWTILRVTQFYDYCLTGVRKLARLPVVPVPAGFRVPTDRPRRGGGPARRGHSGRARRPGTRHGRSTGDQLGRPAPRLAGQPSAPVGPARSDTRHPRSPGRRPAATTRTCRRPPDVGAIPDRESGSTGNPSDPDRLDTEPRTGSLLDEDVTGAPRSRPSVLISRSSHASAGAHGPGRVRVLDGWVCGRRVCCQCVTRFPRPHSISPPTGVAITQANGVALSQASQHPPRRRAPRLRPRRL